VKYDAVVWTLRKKYGAEARAKSVHRPGCWAMYKVGYRDLKTGRNVWTGQGKDWKEALAQDEARAHPGGN
jgi:hypothetical protein